MKDETRDKLRVVPSPITTAVNTDSVVGTALVFTAIITLLAISLIPWWVGIIAIVKWVL